MERVEEAEKQYQLALNIDPKNAAAHNNCGVLLERMGIRTKLENSIISHWKQTQTILQHTTIMEIFVSSLNLMYTIPTQFQNPVIFIIYFT